MKRISSKRRTFLSFWLKAKEIHERKRKQRRRDKRIGRTSRHEFARRNEIPFDSNSRRQQVVLPKNLSLSENFDETVKAINEIFYLAIKMKRSVMIHFVHVETVEPAAALALVAEVHRARALRGFGFVTGTYPKSAGVYHSLNDMGFYKVLKVQSLDRYSVDESNEPKPIFLKFITDVRVDPVLADTFVRIIEDKLIPMNDLARLRLVVALKEAMQNTLDHAHPGSARSRSSQHRWWMSSWVNVPRKEICIVFFDQGVGIPATLEPTSYEKITASIRNATSLRFSTSPSDSEMIAAATEIFRSGTGQPGRGQGFANMKSFVDQCEDGELRVLSNRGCYSYLGHRSESCADHTQSLGGTIIEWRFQHNGMVEMSDD
jgi:anti-sigma regulatory factor (Ser/Thr protein kinase)